MVILRLLHRSSITKNPNKPRFISSPPSLSLFWDLNSKLPTKSTPPLSPYDSSVRLLLSAASLGRLHPPPLAFFHPSSDHLTSPSLSPLQPPFPCRLCGRKFSSQQTLLHHFSSLHTREHQKRLRRLSSATGRRRVLLSGQLCPKISKYEKVSHELFGSVRSSSILDEVSRAGIRVLEVEDKFGFVREEVEKGGTECLMLVADDLGFVRVLREVKGRGVSCVIVGEEEGLRRVGDLGFRWGEVINRKVKEKGEIAGRKWRDKQLLERLEWRYEHDEREDGGEDENLFGEESEWETEEDKPWWKLD